MPVFKVLRRVDAWIDYIAEVEAENPEQAARTAERGDGTVAWTRIGEEEFWNARFATLGERGEELDRTVVLRG